MVDPIAIRIFSIAILFKVMVSTLHKTTLFNVGRYGIMDAG